MKFKFLKMFILVCIIIPSVLFTAGCLNNGNKDLENKLNNAEVLIFDGVRGYVSTEVYAEANQTYYFKVTNNNEINNVEYKLSYITAYDVNNENAELTGDKDFGIEGTNAFWEIKVYDKNKQKMDFIGSSDHHLVDPMAENFYLDFNDTCYFAITFKENIEITFSFCVEELLVK